MNKRTQRILLIVLMAACLVYSIVNYLTQRTDSSVFLFVTAFLGFMLFGQISALIREWND